MYELMYYAKNVFIDHIYMPNINQSLKMICFCGLININQQIKINLLFSSYI